MPRFASTSATPSGVWIWWVLWIAFVGEAIVGYFVLQKTPDPAAVEAMSRGAVFEWLGLVPFIGSVVIRWLILPRQTLRGPGLVAFIAGASLAEGAVIFALILAVEQRNLVFTLGFLGILQYVPLFARKFFA